MTVKKIICIFNVFCAGLIFAQNEKPYFSFFYGGLGVASPQHGGTTLISNYMFSGDQKIVFESSAFNFKSPTLSIGYLYRGKPLFFKADLGYWYGSKTILYSYYYQTPNSDLSKQNGSAYVNPGDVFYEVNKNFQGRVNLNYIDFSASVGKTIGKYISVLAGIRTSSMLYNSIKGNLDISSYKYIYNGSVNSSTFVEKADSHYTNNQAKNKIDQTFQNKLYLTIGINTLFKIGERNGFIELDYYCMANNAHLNTSQNFFNLKAGLSLFKK